MIAALALGAVLFVGTAVGVRMLSDGLFPPPGNTAILDRTLDPALVAEVDAVVRDTPASRLPPIDGPATLDGIRDRGTLRVGYGRDLVPFTYRNRSGDLVGFDISYAYRLAHDLHVRLELVPIEWEHFEDDLVARRLDIVMAGAYVTDKRLENLKSTNPYFESPLAFITRSDRASRFLRYGEVADTPNLALGVLGRRRAVPPRPAALSQGAHRAARNLRRVSPPPGARCRGVGARSGPRLGVGQQRIFGRRRKRHGSAAPLCLLPAAGRRDADPIPQHLARRCRRAAGFAPRSSRIGSTASRAPTTRRAGTCSTTCCFRPGAVRNGSSRRRRFG